MTSKGELFERVTGRLVKCIAKVEYQAISKEFGIDFKDITVGKILTIRSCYEYEPDRVGIRFVEIVNTPVYTPEGFFEIGYDMRLFQKYEAPDISVFHGIRMGPNYHIMTDLHDLDKPFEPVMHYIKALTDLKKGIK